MRLRSGKARARRRTVKVHLLELVTVHPILVHVTVGAMPLLVLAYAVAWNRRSRRWTFAADVALIVAALVTLGTFAFGLVSNFHLPWPAGLETWRWLHLGFGALSTTLIVALAIARLVLSSHVAGPGTAAYALVTALVVGFTGWIGGQVLVYHSGMGVAAAADGALAPQLNGTVPYPGDLMASMGDARFAWASVDTTLASMVVTHPSDGGFAAVEGYADHLRQAALWMQTSGWDWDEASREKLAPLGHALELRAGELGAAARRRDLLGAVHSFGDVTAACADCHERLRWKKRAIVGVR
jgi:uncharacterized membrane protein